MKQCWFVPKSQTNNEFVSLFLKIIEFLLVHIHQQVECQKMCLYNLFILPWKQLPNWLYIPWKSLGKNKRDIQPIKHFLPRLRDNPAWYKKDVERFPFLLYKKHTN